MGSIIIPVATLPLDVLGFGGKLTSPVNKVFGPAVLQWDAANPIIYIIDFTALAMNGTFNGPLTVYCDNTNSEALITIADTGNFRLLDIRYLGKEGLNLSTQQGYSTIITDQPAQLQVIQATSGVGGFTKLWFMNFIMGSATWLVS